jgi:hypothetical protein
VAQTQFNLEFAFSQDFDKHVSAAQAIAEKLHAEGLLTAWAEKTQHTGRSSDRPSFGHKFVKVQNQLQRSRPGQQETRPGRATQGARAQAPTREDREARDREFSRLAKEHNRCYRCGYLLEPGQMEEHRKVYTNKKDDFRRRMGQVAAQVKRGENPNDKLRASLAKSADK